MLGSSEHGGKRFPSVPFKELLQNGPPFSRKSEKQQRVCLATLGDAIHNAHWGAIHFLGILPNPCLFPKVPGTGDGARMELKRWSQHLPGSSGTWVQEEAVPVRGSEAVWISGHPCCLRAGSGGRSSARDSIGRVLSGARNSMQSCDLTEPRDQHPELPEEQRPALYLHLATLLLLRWPWTKLQPFPPGPGRLLLTRQQGSTRQPAWLYRHPGRGIPLGHIRLSLNSYDN